MRHPGQPGGGQHGARPGGHDGPGVPRAAAGQLEAVHDLRRGRERGGRAVVTEREQDLQPGQRKLVLVLVARRAQRVAGRQHRLGRRGQIAPGQGDGTGDDLQHGPVHRPGGEVEVHGPAGYLQGLVPAAQREQRLGLVDREHAARGAGEQLRVRAHGGAAGRLGGTFVLPGPLEQVGLVDRRVQQHVVGASALGHGAGLRDQVEGTAVRGCLLAGVGVEHGQRQQRVRLFRLVAGLPGERQRLLGVGPLIGHLGRAVGQREQDVHPDAPATRRRARNPGRLPGPGRSPCGRASS